MEVKGCRCTGKTVNLGIFFRKNLGNFLSDLFHVWGEGRKFIPEISRGLMRLARWSSHLHIQNDGQEQSWFHVQTQGRLTFFPVHLCKEHSTQNL